MSNIEIYADMELKLQRSNSNFLTALSKDVLDWWFNEAQTRFVWGCINAKLNAKKEGLQSTIKRVDDIANLLTTREFTALVVDTQSAYINLPPDYLHLDSDESILTYDCNGVDKTTETYTRFVAVLPFPTGEQGSADSTYYDTLTLIFGKEVSGSPVEDTLFNLEDYSYYEEGLVNVDETFYIITMIMEALKSNQDGLEVYWEEYDGVTYKNSFIFVYDGEAIVPSYVQWEIDGVVVNDTIDFEEVEDLSAYVYNAANTLIKPNRLVETEVLRDILVHPYHKTKYTSPVSARKRDRLYVYNDNKFVVNKLIINYYRKPRRIDNRVSLTCELEPTRHATIVDIAVELILASFGSDHLQAVKTVNLIHE